MLIFSICFYFKKITKDLQLKISIKKHDFSHFSVFYCSFNPFFSNLPTLSALFLLDNRLEVYLWQRGQPEQTESSASAWSLWHNERKCAMQTALQYCKGQEIHS